MDPAVILLRKEAVIPRRELESLTQKIMARRQQTQVLQTAVSLRVLANGIGGKLKPWGPIYQSLTNGDLPFWLKAGGASTRHIFIDRQDWDDLGPISFDASKFATFPFKTEMNNCDMSEVLNLQPREARAIRSAGLLSTKTYKRSVRYQVDEVLELSRKWVSMTELMRRTGRSDRPIRQRLIAAKVHCMAGLWEREYAEAVSILGHIKRERQPALVG